MPSNPKLKQLEADNGYRGAHFGADTTSFPDLVFVDQIEDLGRVYRSYHRSSDANQFGLAHADEISYSFEQGRLQSINLEFTGRANRDAALDMLTALYGPGLKRPHSSLGDYWWSTEHVLLSLGDGLKPGKYTVSFLSKSGVKVGAKN